MAVKIYRTSREDYYSAWKEIYNREKNVINSSGLFEGINPMLNKPLATEIDSCCFIAKDDDTPIGIFSMVVSSRLGPIGKQFVVAPSRMRKGVGTKLIKEAHKWLLEKGYNKYYIGCSSRSAALYKKLGYAPYSEDKNKDMYKFIIKLNKE